MDYRVLTKIRLYNLCYTISINGRKLLKADKFIISQLRAMEKWSENTISWVTAPILENGSRETKIFFHGSIENILFYSKLSSLMSKAKRKKSYGGSKSKFVKGALSKNLRKIDHNIQSVKFSS